MALDQSAAGKELLPHTYEYNDRDVMLYALGVGASTKELAFVYEKNLQVLPTFAVVPAFPALMGIGRVIEFNPMMLLHGEQRIELKAPIPTSGQLTTQGKISAVYDKGSGALVVVDAETKDANGTLLFTNTFGAFIRGEGGFGGERGPSASKKNLPPEKAPDYTVEYKTSTDQATLYRLSGDRNPLHIDPEFAKMAGFDRPIIHGLCTFGYVGRAILHSVCGGDPARLKDFEVRFSGVAFPGETIVTQIWKESDTRVVVQATTAERGEPVISNAGATIG
ncbi:MAG: MaoC family dehydratase N-terminal domain-containing protein [Chloroflexi bacterium]|nr:MaoC family dehydratase N-terminal domain-containing protein [Chloroflexota bacterium]